MAPLFISCDTLARTRAYSPLSRGLAKANSPGCRSRVVPFVRLTRSIPHLSCGAASQEIHNVQAQSNNNNGDIGIGPQILALELNLNLTQLAKQLIPRHGLMNSLD